MSWVFPPPPMGKPFLTHRQFSELNLCKSQDWNPKELIGYYDGQNFTRFYGSVASDQEVELNFSFSNDELDAQGGYVCEANIADLNYDAEALRLLYDPKKQAATGKFLVTIYGRWLRVQLQPKSEPGFLRCYVRGSVF